MSHRSDHLIDLDNLFKTNSGDLFTVCRCPVGECSEDSAPGARGAPIASNEVLGPNMERDSVAPCYVAFNRELTVVGMR